MSASTSLGFTAGGIDVSSIVTGLMAAERAPLTSITNRQSAVRLQVAGLAKVKTALTALQTSASAFITGGLSKYSSSVSNASVVTATMASSARAGSVSFTVDRLAQSSGLRTVTTVGASTSAVTSSALLALSTTAAKVGITGVTAGTATAGTYTVSVTQATAGATVAGTTVLGGATSISAGAGNNTLDLTIDGVARALVLADGVYTAAGLAAQVQSKIDASGGGATATIDAGGHMKITTTHEGSAASLAIPSGSALVALGIAVTMPAVVGVDGSIKVGSNLSVTVTSAGLAGATADVATGSGNVHLVLGGGLRVGDTKVAVVSTGDKSLGAVAAAINGANIGATASAVMVSAGNWLLQMNSAQTGSANALVLDSAAFATAGGVIETSAAQDAKITVGTGPGAYSITAAGNSFTDVIPGVTLTATALSAVPVTVSVARDSAATADAVSKLVDTANALLKEVSAQTTYDPATRTVAPLSGDPTIRRLAADVRSSVTSLVGGSSIGSPNAVGISTLRDGTFKFDKAVFLTALAADPEGVERLFNRHGSSTGGVTWAGASDETQAGSYPVNVTTAPTRAATLGLTVASLAGKTVGVRVGTTVASFAVPPLATDVDVVAGLNAALAQAGLKVNASLDPLGVRLTSVGYGFASNFDTNLDVIGTPAGWATNTGVDVQGTINGETAIGTGQRLKLLNLGISSAKGIEIDVGEGLTGALGPIEYQPGITARLVALSARLTSSTGILTANAQSYDAKVKGYNDQITKFESRMTTLESTYRRQWSAVQTLLNSLQNQGSWLAGQVASLSK